MFPLKMEELQKVYGDKIPHLTLDGGKIQNAQELYIIHHTKVEEKYRKCLNARFGIADRGMLERFVERLTCNIQTEILNDHNNQGNFEWKCSKSNGTIVQLAFVVFWT